MRHAWHCRQHVQIIICTPASFGSSMSGTACRIRWHSEIHGANFHSMTAWLRPLHISAAGIFVCFTHVAEFEKLGSACPGESGWNTHDDQWGPARTNAKTSLNDAAACRHCAPFLTFTRILMGTSGTDLSHEAVLQVDKIEVKEVELVIARTLWSYRPRLGLVSSPANVAKVCARLGRVIRRKPKETALMVCTDIRS